MGFKVLVVRNDFASWARDLPRRFDDALEETALAIRRDAAARTVYPDLAGGWFIRRTRALRRVVGNRVWWAVFPEHGTPHQPATPMLRPALETAARTLTANLRKAFRG